MKLRFVLSALLVVTLATVALANVLLNPGYEIGNAGGGAVASNWWAYQNCGTENWANRTGSNGMAFWSWDNGQYGGFGQDYSSNLVIGQEITFSIYGLAEVNFMSSDSETWLAIEYWTNDATAWTSQDQLDIYSAITGDPDQWNQYTIVSTVAIPNVVMIKPIVGGGGFTNQGLPSQAVKWDDSEMTITDVIPEPMSALLLGFGIYGAMWLRRRIKK